MLTTSDLKARVLALWACIRQQTPSIDMGDLQLIVGLSALTYGVSLLSEPFAWITFGAFLLAGWLAPRLPRSKKG